MTPEVPPVLLALDLLGTFAFALNGALTALRVARLDIVGVVTLGMITALGGGIIRDVLLGSLPPATFGDWRYLAVAAGGGLIAFVAGRHLERLATPITVLDAAGLSLFAVTGASKALDLGLGPAQAVILGAVTGVGGGTLRDVLVRQVPTVLTSGLYAIPALVGATATVVVVGLDVHGPATAIGAAALCFVVRMVGVHFDLHAPMPRQGPPRGPGDGDAG
ncbi:trimeric intracellular cation channel family protein [Blastococcus sp. SYSU D00820]